MSMEALSGDIFSILRKFSSPRMGQYDNTNAPRPMPPKAEVKANTDAARAVSDPTRYGATGADAGTGLIPQGPGAPPPQPVSRRVVPAGGPPQVTPQAEPVTTGAVPAPLPARPPAAPPPPGDGTAAAALVNAPDGPAATGAAPAAPGEMDFVLNSPIYKFQRMQQQRLYDENERQQRTENVVSGLGKILGAATGVGGGGIKVRGDISEEPTLTFDNLKELQDQKLAAEKMVAMRQVADQIVKENPGMSRAAIEAQLLAHSEKFGDLGFELTSPKAKADLKKTVVDTLKVEADTTKTGVETTKLQQELVDSSILSDQQLIQIGRMTNQPNPTSPETIATLRSMGSQKLAGMVADVAGKAAGVAQPRVWEGDEIKYRQGERQKLASSFSQIPNLAHLNELLDTSRGADSVSAQAVQSAYEEIGFFLGIEKGTRTTQEYAAAIQPAVQKILKAYGSNASAGDLIAAEKSMGAGMHPDAARNQLKLLVKGKVWDAIAHNEEVERMAGSMTEGNAAGQRAQKFAVPPPDEGTLRTAGIPTDGVEALRATVGTPQEKEMRQAFRTRYGNHMDTWVLGELK